MRLRSLSSAVRLMFFLPACFLLTGVLRAQSAPQPESSGNRHTSASSSARRQKIDRQLALLHMRQQAGAAPHELAWRWALLGAEYGNGGNLPDAETAYNRALRLLAANHSEAELYADILDQLGALYRIYGRAADALRCYRTALAIRAPFADPLQDARSHARIAEIALISHDYKEAFAETDQAYRSMLHMSDPDTSEVISALIVRAYAQCGLHHCRQAEQDAAQALQQSRREFSDGSLQAAASLAALGSAQLANGDPSAAEASLRQAVDLFRVQLTAADPRLRYAMERYLESLLRLHRKEEARQVQDQLEAIARQPQPGCIDCSVSAFSARSPESIPTASAGDPAGSANAAAAARRPRSQFSPEP